MPDTGREEAEESHSLKDAQRHLGVQDPKRKDFAEPTG
jgi:hypothetical protein